MQASIAKSVERLISEQKVAGSSLTVVEYFRRRGSAFKFQIAQISTHLNE